MDAHNRPVLAKLYRAFISEAIAALQSTNNCKHIEIQGDCVSGIFNTQSKLDINELFSISAQIISMINILNYKFSKKNITNIAAGIGISYGRALMIKAGLKGSGENGVVWIGDVVNQASKLSGGSNLVYISEVFYNNLTDKNKTLCFPQYSNELGNYYSANIVSIEMDNWLVNCKSTQNNLGSEFLGSYSRPTLFG
jgi:class 3 adenylate cyclase